METKNGLRVYQTGQSNVARNSPTGYYQTLAAKTSHYTQHGDKIKFVEGTDDKFKREMSEGIENVLQNAPWFEAAAVDAKTSFDQNQQKLEADRTTAIADVKTAYSAIIDNYSSGTINGNALLNEMRNTIKNTVTGMANAYNNQAAREGERVDALIASGAMGGNAYRAYQAHTQTARDLMSQAVGQIAQVSMSASESLMNAGIALSQVEQSRISSQNAAIASIAGTQADIMMNYSKMLTDNVVSAQASFQNLIQLNIQQIGQNLNAFIDSKKIEADISMNTFNAQAQLEQAYMDGTIVSTWAGGGLINVRDRYGKIIS